MRYVAVLVALVLLSTAFAEAQQVSSTAIVFGRSIGPVQVGMDLGQARGLLEQFSRVMDAANADGARFCNEGDGVGLCVSEFVYRYDKRETPEAVVKTPGRVASIVTDDQRFTADGGLRVGMTLLDALALLGRPTASAGAGYQWLQRGVEITVTPDDVGLVVGLIVIFAPFLP
jgi:hypothetical protein